MVFALFVIAVVYYANNFPNIELTLHHQHKYDLAIVYNFFDVFLELLC